MTIRINTNMVAIIGSVIALIFMVIDTIWMDGVTPSWIACLWILAYLLSSISSYIKEPD